MLRKLILLVLILVLAACANIGNGREDKMSRDYVTRYLKIGQSTQADVLALYGEPDYKNESSMSDSVWSYEDNRTNPYDVSDIWHVLPSMGYEVDRAIDRVVDDVTRHQRRQSSRSVDFYFNRSGVMTNFSVFG